jgi:AcrR family transcriptional regulator
MWERIQRAALACVADKGFSNVSMGDIIAQAGLSAGAVYVYYRSKEELIVDAGRKVFEERMAALEELSAAGPVPPPEEAIPALMFGLMKMDFFPDVAVQVWGEAVRNDQLGAVARNILDQIRGHIENYLKAWLLTSHPADEAASRARRLAPAVMGLIQGCAIQTALGKEGTGPAYLESARTLLAGL